MNNLNYKYNIYGRSGGRKKNKLINNDVLEKYKFNLQNDIKKNKNNILDIGSGSGENSLFLALKNPNSIIIACEIFQDGNINLCNNLIKLQLRNVKLFTNNVIKLFEQLKIDNYFCEMWLLFPDPWPKNRHHKRRLINNNFFAMTYLFLKKRGKIFIATDSISYLGSIMKSLYDVRSIFRWKNDKPQYWSYEFLDLPSTKFFEKAKNSCKSAFFIELEKR